MKKRWFPILLILGACLILASLSLVAVRALRRERDLYRCREVLEKMETLLPAAATDAPALSGSMPALSVDGVDYVARLEIAALGLALPVTDAWDKGSVIPARFGGSAYDGTLVIGGTNDPQGFGFCKTIETGTAVTVTDMTGAAFSYEVTRVDRAPSAEAAWLKDPEADLTLFCRDELAMEYIAVRCLFT